MIICEICGNEINMLDENCPFCNNRIKVKNKNKIGPIKIFETINIKEDMPIAKDAIRDMKKKIRSVKQKGVKVVKLIHGWGSTGKGGVLRIAIRNELQKMKNIGIINDYIKGEDFSKIGNKQLLQRFPELKNDSDLSKKNKGITIVVN